MRYDFRLMCKPTTNPPSKRFEYRTGRPQTRTFSPAEYFRYRNFLLTLPFCFYMLIGAPNIREKGTSMKLRSTALAVVFAVSLALALVSAAAHAQSGVYVMMDAQQFTQSGVLVNPGTHSNTDRPWILGAGYGVYYDINRLPYLGKLKTGPVVLGIDGRGDTLRQNAYGSQFSRQDGLFSIRVATRNTFVGVTPYVQGGFGIGHTKVPGRTSFSNNFIYQVGVGADRKLLAHVDWRVIDASAGFLGNYSTGYYPAAVGPNQSNYLVTLGTGLVFRLK
jgi:hypothetical protein